MMLLLLTFIVSVACVVDKGYGQGSLQLWPYDQFAKAVFEEVDTDGNRKISLDEVEKSFLIKDGNDDGHVTRYEYTKYTCKTSPNQYELSHYLFDEFDSNDDDKLDTGDFRALFDTVDRTGNGVIRRREFKRYWTTMLPKYVDIGPHEKKYLYGPSKCY